MLRINVLTTASVVIAVGAIVALGSGSARADVAAGKARFNAVCGECHDSADFENELKHKKPLQLSDQEIADIAAYMSTGGK